MSRRTRHVAGKYAEQSDSDEDILSDESFDEDDDPDKIEVPGGGMTLEASRALASAASSSKKTGQNTVSETASTELMSTTSTLPSLVKKEMPALTKVTPGLPINLNTAPNSSSQPRPQQQQLPSSTSHPLAQLDPWFRSMFGNMDQTTVANLYNAILGGDIRATAHHASNTSGFSSQQSSDIIMRGMALGALTPGLDGPLLPFPYVYQQDAPVKPQHPKFNLPVLPQPEEEDMHMGDDEDDGLGVTETYADYTPAKLDYGKRHPDPVVETASLATVLAPDISTKLHLPEKVISSAALSALQLEAVVYACQQHNTFLPSGERAGYLVGDGAGVGKGRTIAGIIYENYMCGRKKALWISVSSDLKVDSERDLDDILAGEIPVFALNKMKYGRITDLKKGVIFSTYSSLIGESSQIGGKYNSRMKQLLDWCGSDFDGCIVFDECHRAKNLCPVGNAKPTKTGQAVFDLQSTLKKARIVYASATGASEPKNMAYMTRLGIWGPSTPFEDFPSFINSVEKRGVGAMELVAMDMKLRGAYIARQLSFHGVAFTIEEVPLSDEFIEMYDASVQLWVLAMQKFIEASELMKIMSTSRKSIWAQFWSAHQRFFKYLCIAAKVQHAVNVAREAIKCGKCVVIGLQSTGEARTLDQLEKDEGELSDFVSTAKGVLQSLVEKNFPAPSRTKVNELLGIPSSMFQELQREMQEDEPCSSTSTGKRKPVRKAAQKAVKRVCRATKDSDDSDSEDEEDSNYSESDGSSSDDFMSGSDASHDSEHQPSEIDTDDDEEIPVKRGRGRPPKKIPGGSNGEIVKPTKEACDLAYKLKVELLEQIEKLGETLPPNTLDQLIDELGGPDDVAEMTGRKGRVIQKEDGQILYESRSETDVSLETINLIEKQRFMDGEKHVAIISEAASSGISLQSDRRVKNQKRRVHITLELPWSADRAIQQFGRTHRSNQVNAPEYVFLISDLAGERRFASIVAKRLESLGALTHGDRRATETRDLSRFHIDSKYGRQALESVMKYIIGWLASPVVQPPSDYLGDFRADIAGGLVGVGLIVNGEDTGVTLEKDFNNLSKFLNRILGMPVKQQNALFHYFVDTLNTLISDAKKTGRFEMGIMDLMEKGDSKSVKVARYKLAHSTGTGFIDLVRITVDRGLSWTASYEKFASLSDDTEGYYLCKQIRNGKQLALLAVADKSVVSSKGSNTAKTSVHYCLYRPNTGAQLRRETLTELKKKYNKVSADDAQKHWVTQYESSGVNCVHAFWSGKCRQRVAGFDCDTGSRTRTYHVLSGVVMRAWRCIEGVLHSSGKLQIVRAKDEEGNKLVGVMIPNSMVNNLRNTLGVYEVRKEVTNKIEKVQRSDNEDN